MQKDTKTYLYLVIIVVLIIGGIYLYKYYNKPVTDVDIAKCIGKNSVLYMATGCSACKAQEEMFGDNYQYLTKIDCINEGQKCIDAQITGTPTWIIKNKKYPGVQTIDKLKELTGC